MATENCASDRDLPVRKRGGISFEASCCPPISKLGDDVLVEIIIRLPNPRSACQCKHVCKRWSSLISSPCFNRRFVSHHQTMKLHQPAMPGNPNELQSFVMCFLPPMPCRVGDTFKVLDCVKDLVLCGFWELDCDNGEPGRSFLVCNPFTKQWVALPLAPEKSKTYEGPVARLVCEPRIAYNLDLGDEQSFVYSEYRFRVVCMYQDFPLTLKLDVFCSESKEWTKEALVLDHHHRIGTKSVSSCNGELFWAYFESLPGGVSHSVAMFNPFCLDVPPTSIDASAFFEESSWTISVSQGALHVITYKTKTASLCPIIWKLEEDRKSWKKLCEGVVKKKSRGYGYEPEDCFLPFLHPYNPEIVFFHCQSALLYCDLRREELEFFAQIEGGSADRRFFKVFEPRVSCWPTPIPSYEELQGMYNGSFNFWVQTQQLPR